MQINQLSEFGNALLFIVLGLFFILGGLFTAKLVRPSRPNPEKLTSYECGEDPQGSAWGSFNIRFYIIALIFILFEVEVVFLFPWATVFGDKELIESTDGLWGWFALTEVIVFVGILVLGLAYAWAKGYLDWVQSDPHEIKYKGKVPLSLYDSVNDQYSDEPTKKAA